MTWRRASLLLIVALGAPEMPAGRDQLPADWAWITVHVSRPSSSLERLATAFGSRVPGPLLELLSVAGSVPAQPGSPQEPWLLDPSRPVALGFAWFPTRHFVAGCVRDALHAEASLARYQAEDAVPVPRDGGTLFAGEDWAFLSGDLMCVADTAGLALTVAEGWSGCGVEAPETGGDVARITVNVEAARAGLAAVTPLAVWDALVAAPDEGPVTRRTLAVARLVAMLAEEPLHQLQVDAAAGFLRVSSPDGARAGACGSGGHGVPPGRLRVAGKGGELARRAETLALAGLALGLEPSWAVALRDRLRDPARPVAVATELAWAWRGMQLEMEPTLETPAADPGQEIVIQAADLQLRVHADGGISLCVGADSLKRLGQVLRGEAPLVRLLGAP